MTYGTIKNWNDNRGWGFIAPANGGPDVFAHVKYFARGVLPEVGLRVQFEIIEDGRDRRPRADDVRFA